ncbi:membrane fusion protein of tripartite multidrug resistance system [Methylomonas methanica]|uniref:Membrane fusion protein of tripartite multidrug resistance system n=2 Tax=Methylomonas methanica TaxID=421 RepID=A0A177MKR9_METMH|nr:membrane fusion protein of tripartite multidrug resistance system [Methylomonas methanica]
MTSSMQKKIRPREILRQRRRRLQGVTLALLLAGLVYLAYWWLVHRDWIATDDAFVAGHLITLKTQTDGTVVEVLTENTLCVEKGQLLVRLDGVHAGIALQQTQAELAEAVRNIVSLRAKSETLKQRVLAKQAVLEQVNHDLARFNAAAKDGAVSDQQLQTAQDKIRELDAAIKEIRAEQSGVDAQLLDSGVDNHPAVEKAKSRLRQAYLDYQRRNLLAPVSGCVAKRKVEVGDTLKAGAPLLAIVPLDDLWIEANFLESQIAGVRSGQAAEIRVAAYGDDRVYHGRVQGINPGTGSIFALLPTDNATGNFIHIAERMQVRVALDAAELKANPLQPGLSTLTRIKIANTDVSVTAPKVVLNGEAYHTDIYDRELEGAEQLIEGIELANRLR